MVQPVFTTIIRKLSLMLKALSNETRILSNEKPVLLNEHCNNNKSDGYLSKIMQDVFAIFNLKFS